MNYKIHFGKNISYKSNIIELLHPENITHNLIYVKNDKLTLLAPGLHNQYLAYVNGKYIWQFMEGDFYQGVWTLSLYSTDFFTPDGYGYAIDINPEAEYTYPQYMAMPYIDEEIIGVSGYCGRESNNYIFSAYPAVEGIAEYGGVFYYEIYNANKLNISINSNLNVIENDIISSNGEYTEINGNLSNELFEDEVTLLTSPIIYTAEWNSENKYWEIDNLIIKTTSEYNTNVWKPYKIFNPYYENRIDSGWQVQLTDVNNLPQSITLINTTRKILF